VNSLIDFFIFLLLKYTAKNEARMSALDQRLSIIPQVHQAIKNAKPVIWLVLTEGWCGDAASSVPVIARIAALYPEKIEPCSCNQHRKNLA